MKDPGKERSSPSDSLITKFAYISIASYKWLYSSSFYLLLSVAFVSKPMNKSIIYKSSFVVNENRVNLKGITSTSSCQCYY